MPGKKANCLAAWRIFWQRYRTSNSEYELTQIANGRLAFEREETEHTLTGEEIVVSIRCSVAPGYEDSLAKVIVSTLDVTERRRAEQKVRHHLTELEALNRVSTALRIAQTQEEMLPILLDETLAALGCADGVVWLYHPEDGNLRIAAARGWFTRFKDAPLKPGEGIAGNVFASGKIHHSVEFARDPLARVPPGMTIPAGWGGVCVPVYSAAEVTGVIFVSMRLPRQVTPEETKLLESLAEMTGIALHRLALHEETVQRLYQLQALQTIDRAITSSFDLRVSLGVLLEQTITLLKADAADVLTFAPHTQTLDYIAGRGFRSPAAERTQCRWDKALPGAPLWNGAHCEPPA
ncbi:MAG: GAF domain-containing protein [Chloroflexi bacterium]|nr:GAF domain-containing protein [Chloroflexota bacterium]